LVTKQLVSSDDLLFRGDPASAGEGQYLEKFFDILGLMKESKIVILKKVK
jgi:hypothetical protein